MARLSSLSRGYRALVFGASGGIGAAVAKLLAEDPHTGSVCAAARRPLPAGCKAQALRFDLDDEQSIAEAVARASADGPLDLVFVATGVLQDAHTNPEKSFKVLNGSAMDHAFRVNAIGPALIAKYALPKMRKDEKAVFAALSARVGSISDNRLGGWHSYRASKAALNMLVRNFAIELARSHPKAVCVTLHPGTVDTGLSKPFQGNVAEGKLFAPEQSADALLHVLDTLGPEDTGKLFAWDGQAIPF